MYCSTCGASIPASRSACDTCGASSRSVERWEELPPLAGPRPDARLSVRTMACPRCDYEGQGLPYFSKGTHIAGLVALTLFTFPIAFGAAGVIYWAVRRDHQICPRCGFGWGRHSEGALLPMSRPASRRMTSSRITTEGESAKRLWSILLFIVSGLFLIGGMAGPDLAAALVGVGVGAGGFALHRAANTDRDARRQALLGILQSRVVSLAREQGGTLTVTGTAAVLGWPMRRAEKVLNSLDDGLRVDSEVTDEGVIVYHFRELLLGRGPDEG